VNVDEGPTRARHDLGKQSLFAYSTLTKYRTSEEVPLLCSPFRLGSLVVDDEETTWVRWRDFLQLLDACVGELGVPYLDSAQGVQKSEESIGQFLQGKPAGFRDTLVIGLKVSARPTGREIVRVIGRQSLETLKCGVISVDGRIRTASRAPRRLGRDFTRKGRAGQQDPCL